MCYPYCSALLCFVLAGCLALGHWLTDWVLWMLWMDACRYETKTSRVFRLIEYSQHFNKGQGIGFVIFGTTINRRVLLACE